MTQKVPPPPSIANSDPAFNRWLIELTAILNAGGGIDPNTIPGFTSLSNQVDANTTDITTLQNAMALAQAQIAALTLSVAIANSAITTLSARAQVFQGSGAPAGALGAVNDWYANVGGGAGARIYIKTAPGTWTPFPF